MCKWQALQCCDTEVPCGWGYQILKSVKEWVKQSDRSINKLCLKLASLNQEFLLIHIQNACPISKNGP